MICFGCGTDVNIILLHLGEQMGSEAPPRSFCGKKYINFELERNISGVKNSIHHPGELLLGNKWNNIGRYKSQAVL